MTIIGIIAIAILGILSIVIVADILSDLFILMIYKLKNRTCYAIMMAIFFSLELLTYIAIKYLSDYRVEVAIAMAVLAIYLLAILAIAIYKYFNQEDEYEDEDEEVIDDEDFGKVINFEEFKRRKED